MNLSLNCYIRLEHRHYKDAYFQVYDPSEKTFYERVNEISKSKVTKYLMDIITEVVSYKNPFLFFGVSCILEIVCMLYKPYRAKAISSLLIYGTVELGQKLRDGEERRHPIEINGSREITNVDLIPYMVSGVTFTKNNLEIFATFDFNLMTTMTYDNVGLNLQLDKEVKADDQQISFMIRWLKLPRNTNTGKAFKILVKT